MTFQTRIIAPIYRDIGQSDAGLTPAVEEALSLAWMRQIPSAMRPKPTRERRATCPEWVGAVFDFLCKGPATRVALLDGLSIGSSTLDYCLRMLRLTDRIEVTMGPNRFNLFSVKDVA
jgi:hypothetical protein